MAMILVPLEGCFLASCLMELAYRMSLIVGFGKTCWSSATRPAMSGLLSLAPMLARSSETSYSSQNVYLVFFRLFSR